jgi:hypothetical protein
LDVKILVKLKAFVRREYRNLQIQMAAALVPTVDVIKLWVTDIRKVLQGHAWGRACDEWGYSQDAASVMAAIRSIFVKAGNSNYETPDARPTENELLHILPTKRRYEFNALLWRTPATASSLTQTSAMSFSPPLKRSAGGGGIPSPSSSATDGRVCIGKRLLGHSDVPIAMRTRSHTRIQEDSPWHSPGPTAPAALTSAPCPSLMSLVSPAAEDLGPHRRRLRARAVPPANKQRL